MTIPRSRDNRGYGYIPDLPDRRDLTMRVTAPRKLPASVLLHRHVAFRFPVYDQGELGSCTANAIAAAFEYELRRQKLMEFRPSRLAIYFSERRIEGTVTTDAGAMIRDGMKVVANEGAADEGLWPYVIQRFAEQPPSTYAQEAQKRQVIAYERVPQSQKAIMAALAAGYPVVFGISVYDSFESQAVAETGKVPMPAAKEGMIGGHAILMTGYQASQVWFRNSWGDAWGKAGHGTLPWKYVLDPDLAEDFWILKVIES